MPIIRDVMLCETGSYTRRVHMDSHTCQDTRQVIKNKRNEEGVWKIVMYNVGDGELSQRSAVSNTVRNMKH